jgi:hypothetical protein
MVGGSKSFFESLVSLLREEPGMPSRDAHARLVALGFAGRRTAFHEILRTARLAAAGFAPGETAQHGLGVAHVTVAGRARRLTFLASRLCHSKAGGLTWLAHEPELVLRAMLSHYATFGGRPETAILHGFRQVYGALFTSASAASLPPDRWPGSAARSLIQPSPSSTVPSSWMS